MNDGPLPRIPFGRVSMAVAVLLVIDACSPATPTPPQVGTIEVATSDPTSASPSQGSGECAHDYFPSEEGTSWQTQGTIDGTAYTSTASITESRDDGFTIVSDLTDGSGTFSMEVSCSDDGLIMLDPVQQATSASVTTDEGSATVTTLAQTGVSLPSDLEGASTWQQYVAWRVEAPGTVLQGDTTTEFVSGGFEVVTVPFGTFEAIRVDSEVVGTLEGAPLMTCQSTNWYAKDIGVIKGEQTCSSMYFTSELISFDSP